MKVLKINSLTSLGWGSATPMKWELIYWDSSQWQLKIWDWYSTYDSLNLVWNLDSSTVALKNNVLELNNVNVFTPDTDYEPATKKYVDDLVVDPLHEVVVYNNYSHTDSLEHTMWEKVIPGGTIDASTWIRLKYTLYHWGNTSFNFKFYLEWSHFLNYNPPTDSTYFTDFEITILWDQSTDYQRMVWRYIDSNWSYVDQNLKTSDCSLDQTIKVTSSSSNWDNNTVLYNLVIESIK